MSVQLRLFPLKKPLVERLGNEFFKGAPREPGIYIMRGGGERILYIGQSKNLRTRLAYYKNANPDRMPRRLVRLVHQVENISWECCSTAEAARARELELLQLHRPRFNRADTAPQSFHFIEITLETTRLNVRLHFDCEPVVAICHGPFRGKMIPAMALAALQRLWLLRARQLTRCDDLPILPKRLTGLKIEGSNEQLVGAARFFQGVSNEVVTTLLAEAHPGCEAALRQLQETDGELLMSWWRALGEAS